MVTNTPDVLNEEVADTALGLIFCAVRQLPQADRYLRQGEVAAKAVSADPRPSRPHARHHRPRADRQGDCQTGPTCGVTIVYHGRKPQPDVGSLFCLARRDGARSDILLVIMPGGAGDQASVNAEVLEALGPEGVLINVARGSVVDEDALIEALRDRKIHDRRIDVFANEPRVPQALIDMEHVVLLPHVGSASVHTRNAMGQLVVDNLLSYAAGQAGR